MTASSRLRRPELPELGHGHGADPPSELPEGPTQPAPGVGLLASRTESISCCCLRHLVIGASLGQPQETDKRPKRKGAHIHPTHPFLLSQATLQGIALNQAPVLSNLRWGGDDIKYGCPSEVPLEGGQRADSSLRRNRVLSGTLVSLRPMEERGPDFGGEGYGIPLSQSTFQPWQVRLGGLEHHPIH